MFLHGNQKDIKLVQKEEGGEIPEPNIQPRTGAKKAQLKERGRKPG